MVELTLKQKMRALRKHYGGKCDTCGTSRNLDFAHLRPTALKGEGRGMSARYYDIKKHPKAYTLRCHRCNIKKGTKRRG